MKKTIVALCLFGIACVFAFSDEAPNGPEPVTFVFGPRVGLTYSFLSQSAYNAMIDTATHGAASGDYFQGNTAFGTDFEQRIVLGNTANYFSIQELLSIDGFEQSIAIPIASLLLGYRDAGGLEFGIGPTVSPAGISVVGSVGWVLEFNGILVPVDISAVVPNNKVGASVSLTTGFNFQIWKKKQNKQQ